MPAGIYLHKSHSKETRKKMSNSHRGRKFSDSHKKKLSKARKGSIPWNKGSKGLIKHSEQTKQKMSEAHKGKKPYVMTDEIRKNMSEARKGKFTGSNSPSWKGGINRNLARRA